MTRVKRGFTTHRRHSNLIARAKGFRRMNGNVYTHVRTALLKAWVNAYIGRKQKKRDFRRLWNIRINNAARLHGLTYSTLIHGLYEKRIGLDRKTLSNLAIEYPSVFAKVAEAVK